MTSSIKVDLGLIITAAVLVSQPAHSEADRSISLATIEIMTEPDTKTIPHKNSPGISTKPSIGEQSRATELNSKSHKLKKKISVQGLRKIKISGYRGETYVYGEVVPSKNGKLEGFIYHPANGMTYVYGKKNNKTINLFDASGNSYQMKSE